jgi:hypothetical protein
MCRLPTNSNKTNGLKAYKNTIWRSERLLYWGGAIFISFWSKKIFPHSKNKKTIFNNKTKINMELLAKKAQIANNI